MQRNTSVRYPGGRRTAWGVAGYLLGYILTYSLAGSAVGTAVARTVVSTEEGPRSLATVLGNATIPAWSGAGWLFYNAHFVPVTVPRPSRPPVLRNLVLAADGPFLGLLLVPPLLLVLSGAMVTRTARTTSGLRFDLGGRSWLRYALNGGLISLLGYLPAVLVGAIASSISAGLRMGPDVLYSWVVAGLLYPLVFGGVGGVLVHRWKE